MTNLDDNLTRAVVGLVTLPLAVAALVILGLALIFRVTRAAFEREHDASGEVEPLSFAGGAADYVPFHGEMDR